MTQTVRERNEAFWKNPIINSILVVLFFVILRMLVTVTKLANESEVNARKPDAASGDHGKFFSLNSTGLPMLALFDGMILGDLICRFSGVSFRKYRFGQFPFWGFLAYQTCRHLSVLLLVNMSHRCTSTTESFSCPMGLPWKYLEAFYQLPDKYVTDQIAISAIQGSFVVIVVAMNFGGEWLTNRYIKRAAKDAKDASYKSIDTVKLTSLYEE